MQHLHGVPSWCAPIARWMITSPILFSTFTPSRTVLVSRSVDEKTTRTSHADEEKEGSVWKRAGLTM